MTDHEARSDELREAVRQLRNRLDQRSTHVDAEATAHYNEFVRLLDGLLANHEARPSATDADRAWLEQHAAEFDEGWAADVQQGRTGPKPRNHAAELLARLSATDAARAAEAMREAAAVAMENLAFFTDVDELLGMTKQEMSVRTCHEGAAAIRALPTTLATIGAADRP